MTVMERDYCGLDMLAAMGGEVENSNICLPDRIVETPVRCFFKESSNYGFIQIDYVRFVNLLLDLPMESSENRAVRQSGDKQTEVDYIDEADNSLMELSTGGECIFIRKFNPVNDIDVLKQWLKDKSGRQFLLSRITAQTINIDIIINDAWNVFGIITTYDDTPIRMRCIHWA